MVRSGHAPAWTGPIRQTPWWWTYILQLEERIDSLNQTAAYDPDKKPPPKDLLPLAKSAELDAYLEGRGEERDRRAREQQPLNDY